eukprot:4369328-Lingulodinium_polyedra.AAC.1
MSSHVIVTHITKEDDFTRQATCDRIIQILMGPYDALFYSSPCTGGLPWQRINCAKAQRRGCEQ